MNSHDDPVQNGITEPARWVNAIALFYLITSIQAVKVAIADCSDPEEMILLGTRLVNLVIYL